MREPAEPLYLARQTYRRRRLQDAARFLPFLGGILMIFPALWSDVEGGPSPGTAERGLYIFVAWFLLILGAGLLSRRLIRSEAAHDESPHAEDAG